ncbi:MAG: 2'-5' RNA ligase family protein [Bdellovibrionales bacterium]
MRTNIYLSFDEATEAAIKNLRAKLDEKLGRNLMETVQYFLRHTYKMPPHLSLFVFDDNDQESVIKKFKEFADGIIPFNIDLFTTDNFRGECDDTLFIKPRLSEELKACYARALNLFSDAFIMPPYRSLKKWQPHITLTKIETDMAYLEAEEFVEESWKPMTASIKKIGLIDVKNPLEVLAEREFIKTEKETDVSLTCEEASLPPREVSPFLSREVPPCASQPRIRML